LWVLGIASTAIGLVLLAIDAPMWDAGGPGIVGFELAGSEEKAAEILAEWDRDAEDAARLSLWLDFLYLALYGAFWALAAAAIRDRSRRVGWGRYAAIGTLAVFAAPIAAACDAIEDVALLLVLGGHGGSVGPPVAAFFATAKFALLFFAVGYVLLGLVRRRLLASALLAVVAFAFVMVVVVVEDRRSIDGEGLAVYETGEGPPLVLIHGFSVDHTWWDRVVPALAKRHRVVTVDLLGHGRSPKPTEGYTMEEHADRVAEELQERGVDRATVVGHSLGGAVAVALAERQPRLVRRLMVIGTGPEDPDGASGNPFVLATFLPVTGHLIRAFEPHDLVRAFLEDTLLPEVDLSPEQAEAPEHPTWQAYHGSAFGFRDYRSDTPLDTRVKRLGVPFAAIFGADDDEADKGIRYRAVPGARVTVLPGLGHSPQLERPGRVARLISDFAR
jgi:pimeloyl-ACP methyl ester carboxylesterase